MTQLALNRIRTYYKEQCHSRDARGRSWDYCNRFFRENCDNLGDVRDSAALHLGFYLASWGMYRGRSFLSQRAYTVHEPVIDALACSRFSKLWRRDVGADEGDVELVDDIIGLVQAVRAGYEPFTTAKNKKPSDTLVTKVLLGTVGCLPARDTFFEQGFKAHFKDQSVSYGSLDEHFVRRIMLLCIENRRELERLRHERGIVDLCGHPYPRMKLVDMHFWQIGYDKARR